MSTTEYLIILLICTGCMLACRVVPLFVLKGRELGDSTRQALSLIPAAAFAALVTNDLFSSQMVYGGDWTTFLPLLAAVPVFLIASKTKNLLLCAVIGVIVYLLLMMLPG